jgi:hypothetical protein
MQTNYSKVILKTARNTLLGIVVLMIMVIGSLTIFSPVSLAKLTSSLGLDNISIYYYQLNFNKTEDINDLYILLNKAILAENDSIIIDSFETLYDEGNDNYYEFIDYVNDFNLTGTTDFGYKLYLANEDARLKGKYISSLMNEDEFTRALNFSATDFYGESIETINDDINYILGDYLDYLISIDAQESYFQEIKDYSYLEQEPANLIEESFLFYNSARIIFDANYLVTADADANLALGIYANSLIKMLNTLITIDTKTDTSLNVAFLTAERDDLLVKLQLLI